MPQPEFVKLDGQHVRVTSLKENGAELVLVIVTRGSADAEFVHELAQKSAVFLELPDQEPATWEIAKSDLRGSGEDERRMVRAEFTLLPAATAEASSAETQLDRIERKLDELLRRTLPS
jgi:hypothetical protein